MLLICKNNKLKDDVYGDAAHVTIGKKYEVKQSKGDENIFSYYDDRYNTSIVYMRENKNINYIYDVFYTVSEIRDLKIDICLDE